MKKLLTLLAISLFISTSAISMPRLLNSDKADGKTVRLLDKISDTLSDDYNTKASMKFFNMEEESYVDDIPFNTRQIFEECMKQKWVKGFPCYEEEPYVDDIPFDTKKIVKNLK